MLNLEEVIEELSSVFDKPVADKLGHVMLSVYERLHESLVLQRLDLLERRVSDLSDEWRRAHAELLQRIEQQLAQSRLETDARFRELVVAQRRTDERVERLAEEFAEYRKQTDARFAELADAQRRTEEQVRELSEFQRRAYEEFQEYRKQTDVRFAELAEAQRRTEEQVRELSEFQRRAHEEFQEYRKQTDVRFAELAEFQRRAHEEFQEYRKQTDVRFAELVEFQRRAYEEFQEFRKQTDVRFAELVEAQRRTEEQVANLTKEVRALAKSHKDLQKQVGGMSLSFGYVLENEAIKKLPDLLLRDYGIQVEGKLRRQFVRDKSGREIEVNLFGTGRRNGEVVTIVGESKAQLSKNDIDRFLRRTLGSLEGVYPTLFPVLVTHMVSESDAERHAREVGVALYYSYDL